MERYYKDGKLEYPPDHIGIRSYVTVKGFAYFVPKLYCFLAGDGRYYLIGDESVKPVAPMIMKDIEPYKSMVDGSMITSRSYHRDHLRDNGLIEVGNEKPKGKMPSKPMDRAGYDIKRAMEKL